MKKTTKEPGCHQPQHDWQALGTEDNGETVDRCGSCLALRYHKGKKVRYEIPKEHKEGKDET